VKPGRWDFIVRADLRDVVARPLREAERVLHPGILGAALARLPGGRWRRLAAGLERLVEAVRASTDWQRARVDYLEALVAGLAASRPPRIWRGAGESPVLLLGTGGGGTRLLGEAAVRLGVNLGARVNESFDSAEWAPLVYDLALAPSGDAVSRIRARAEAVHAVWPADRWGVKLPELLLVLPAFLDAFPDAQVVWLLRHPVAASLRRHHITSLPDHPLGRLVLEAGYRELGRDPSAMERDPQHLRNAVAWRYQVGLARRALAQRSRLELRVEDFQTAPVATLDRMADFLGRPRPAPHDWVRVDDERLAIPRHDRRAAAVMEVCGALARELGYDPTR